MTTVQPPPQYEMLREKMVKRTRPVRAKDARPNDLWPIMKRLVVYMAGGDKLPRFILALALSMLAVIALVLIPYINGRAVDVMSTPGGTVAELGRLLLYSVVGIVVYLIAQFFVERLINDLATRGLSDLQQDLFNHMQELSISFFDRQPLGQLLSRVTNDTEVVAGFYQDVVATFIRSIFQIVLIVIVMFLTEWRLALIAILMAPMLLAVTAILQRVSGPAFARLQEQVGIISGFQEETISGTRVIISNGRQDWAERRNDALANDVYDTGSRAFFVSLLQFPVTLMSSMLLMIVVLIIGSLQSLMGNIPVGVVVSFLGYVTLLTGPLSGIANLTSSALNAVAGARRVFSIIDEQPTITDAPDAEDYEFKGGHVEFQDVDFSYVPGKKILRHNTFEALPGQKIGICGPTGAGKSTIMNILTRYYDVDSGRVLLDGQDISRLTQESLRQQIGMVLQEAYLFSDTVMNNLMYAREGATEEECIAAAKQANAHEFIVNLPHGYDTLLTERGANLSQGQRQMITIARAMVANPKLLCLDEATSNVDTRTEKLIQEGLRKLMEGRTSFVIAHRLSTIRDSAKILVVNGGEIVEQGTHDELMAWQGFYYTLYMSQFKGKGPAGAAGGTADFVST